MLNQSVVKVIGYQWVSSRPHSACPACASLHGQKFYNKPKDGQKSVADMPTPPLHPNCRCTRVEMVEFCDMSEELGSEVDLKPNRPKVPRPILSAEDKQDGRVILGLVFGENDRPLFSGGPGYGNFGGGYRSKGRNTDGMTEDEISRLPEVKPVDKMDAAFQVHDDGYSLCRRRHSRFIHRFPCNIEVDRVLAESLKKLPEDPNQWGRGELSPAEKEYAERYRQFAYWFFKIQVTIYDIAIPRKKLFNISPYLMEHS